MMRVYAFVLVWLGVAVALFFIQDILVAVFHPRRRGIVMKALIGSLWPSFRRRYSEGIAMIVIVLSLASWSFGIIVGFSLVFVGIDLLYEGRGIFEPHTQFKDAILSSSAAFLTFSHRTSEGDSDGAVAIALAEGFFGIVFLAGAVSYFVQVASSIGRFQQIRRSMLGMVDASISPPNQVAAFAAATDLEFAGLFMRQPNGASAAVDVGDGSGNLSGNASEALVGRTWERLTDSEKDYASLVRWFESLRSEAEFVRQDLRKLPILVILYRTDEGETIDQLIWLFIACWGAAWRRFHDSAGWEGDVFRGAGLRLGGSMLRMVTDGLGSFQWRSNLPDDVGDWPDSRLNQEIATRFGELGRWLRG